jgi:hypothetical protein
MDAPHRTPSPALIIWLLPRPRGNQMISLGGGQGMRTCGILAVMVAILPAM